MVGTFAQPDGVFIDPEVLSTLGQRELIEGMGRSHQVRSHPRYGTLGRIGSYGWFCPEYFRACREHHFPFLPGEARPCGGRRAGQWHSTVSQFWSLPSGMPLKRQLVMGR